MATTGAELLIHEKLHTPSLPAVRRLEAVGFRAWPAADVQYDGSWLIRLTAGHPSKRLNSINPLDPFDSRDIAARLEKAAKRFSDFGRPLTIRQTPLTPPELIAHIKADGWHSFGETIVMMADIPANDMESVDHLPIRDVGRFVDAVISISGDALRDKAGLAEVIASIKPENGLFLFEKAETGPVAVGLAVHDNDLVGLLQIAVSGDYRRQGLGSAIVNSSLRWARLRGARKAWLSVEAANGGAIGLYRKFGFREVYRYAYWRKGTTR